MFKCCDTLIYPFLITLQPTSPSAPVRRRPKELSGAALCWSRQKVLYSSRWQESHPAWHRTRFSARFLQARIVDGGVAQPSRDTLPSGQEPPCFHVEACVRNFAIEVDCVRLCVRTMQLTLGESSRRVSLLTYLSHSSLSVTVLRDSGLGLVKWVLQAIAMTKLPLPACQAPNSIHPPRIDIDTVESKS